MRHGRTGGKDGVEDLLNLDNGDPVTLDDIEVVDYLEALAVRCCAGHLLGRTQRLLSSASPRTRRQPWAHLHDHIDGVARVRA